MSTSEKKINTKRKYSFVTAYPVHDNGPVCLKLTSYLATPSVSNASTLERAIKEFRSFEETIICRLLGVLELISFPLLRFVNTKLT